jgi:CDP-6-deoxy-D-xylo-4-hexulose-3-dehydrase
LFTNHDELKVIAESYTNRGRGVYCQPGKDNTCGKRFCQKLGNLPKGYDHKYTYSHLGYNLKITGMHAACGLAKLGKVGRFIQACKKFQFFLKKDSLHVKSMFNLLLPLNILAHLGLALQ